MKVTTKIKAGNIIDDAARQLTSLGSQTTGFVSSANQQANDLVTRLQSAAQSTWQTISSPFKSR